MHLPFSHCTWIRLVARRKYPGGEIITELGGEKKKTMTRAILIILVLMFTLSKSARSCCFFFCLHFPWVCLCGVKRNVFWIPLTEPVYTGNNAKWRYKLRLRVLSNFDERQTSKKNSQCEIRRIRDARGSPKSHFRHTAYLTRLRGPHDARMSLRNPYVARRLLFFAEIRDSSHSNTS